MRLAMVTPLNPRATGVADYSLDLLPYLAQISSTKIYVYSNDFVKPGEGWIWCPAHNFATEASKYDVIIYQMGNSPAHDFMATFLFRFPGLIVLHDLCLYHFYARQVMSGNIAKYLRTFAFENGPEGFAIAKRCLQGSLKVEYPHLLLSEWPASRSLGVIVHSQHAAHMLSSRCPWIDVAVVPMPVELFPSLSSQEARKRLALPQEIYLILVFGVLNESKNPWVIFDAFEMLLARGVTALLVFIGPENSDFHVSLEIERRGLESSVKYLGFVDDRTILRQWLTAADIAINLRSLYWGETPSSVLRVLAEGTPCIVNDVGAFSELPDEACIKLPTHAPNLAQDLYQVLLDLWLDYNRLRNMGRAARNYMEAHHTPQRTAEIYWAVINTIWRG